MAYVVQLKDFEGPLDLLLHLIGRAKVRIEDIFVSEITEQYLASVQDLSGLDMDAASEFLQMAATLMGDQVPRAAAQAPPRTKKRTPRRSCSAAWRSTARSRRRARPCASYEAEAAEMVARCPWRS